VSSKLGTLVFYNKKLMDQIDNSPITDHFTALKSITQTTFNYDKRYVVFLPF